MTRLRECACAIGIVALTAQLAACLADASEPLSPPLAASMPVRDALGIHYQGVGEPEQEPWGPSALRAADDGSFFIVDTAGQQLIVLDRERNPVETIALGPSVRGASDVLVREHDLFVLDPAAMFPHVVRFSRDGTLLGDYPIPRELESQVDGFLVSPDGRVLLHGGGVAVSELRGERFDPELSAYTVFDRTLGLAFPDAPAGDALGHTVSLATLDGQAELQRSHFVSSVRLLRVLQDGRSAWSLEEVSFDPVVLVDATAVLLDPAGRVLGTARLPVAGQAVFVPHVATVDEDGRLFALHTREDGAELEELAWEAELAPVLDARIAEARAARPPAQMQDTELPTVPTDGDVSALAQAAVACRTTQEMMDVGFEYVNSATWVSANNLDRANTRCDGRKTPRYLSPNKHEQQANQGAMCTGPSPGIGYECVRSVPYDWGGADSVVTYRGAMAKGMSLGDTDKTLPVDPNGKLTGIESCSRGTDCSGFISRAWDVKAWLGVARVTTASIPRYSFSLSDDRTSHPGCEIGERATKAGAKDPQAAENTLRCRNEGVAIRAGDVLLLPGSHVTMFRRFGHATAENLDGQSITGRFPFHFESTTARSFDRVIYYFWSWSRFDSYEPRRFRSACS